MPAKVHTVSRGDFWIGEMLQVLLSYGLPKIHRAILDLIS